MSAYYIIFYFFFFSSRRRHTRLQGDWSSDVCSSDLIWRIKFAHLPSSMGRRQVAAAGVPGFVFVPSDKLEIKGGNWRAPCQKESGSSPRAGARVSFDLCRDNVEGASVARWRTFFNSGRHQPLAD